MQVGSLGCPRCQLPLFVGHAPTGALHGCGRCGGVWVDHQTGQRVTQALCEQTLSLTDGLRAGQAPITVTQTSIPCPVCAKPLRAERIARANVEIDKCDEHGSWFDAGELRAATRAVAAERAYGGGGAWAAAATTGAVAGVAGGAIAFSAAQNPSVVDRVHRNVDQHGETAVEVASYGLVDVGDVAEGASITEDIASGAFDVFGSLLGSLFD